VKATDEDAEITNVKNVTSDARQDVSADWVAAVVAVVAG
jgi:hypothetical protein